MDEKRILFASYQRLTELAQQVVSRDLLEKVEIYNESFGTTLEIAKDKVEQNRVDVIISGGSNYVLLRENIRSVPVVPIEISGMDLLEALTRACEYNNHVAVVSYKDYLSWDDSYSRLFAAKVDYMTYSERPRLKAILGELKARGCGCVLGTSLVCDFAEELGMESVFLYSKSSLTTALQRAVELQASIQREQERSQQMSLILSLIPSGIIAINSKQEITLYNPAAARLTGIPVAEALGRKIEKVLPTTRLPQVIKTGQAERNLQTMPNGTVILTDRVPINVQGRVRGALATFNATDEITRAERQIRLGFHKKGLVAKHNFTDIAGSSKLISEARKLAEIYAGEDATVLITGETGTGKELFAQSIHNLSKRREEPFVTINCAALSEGLLESELFGYDEGAFTGARKGGKVGLLELGHMGTIFLDEIGQISDKVQSRLLRVLEEKEIMRVGSDKVIPVDIRVIAASNVPLSQEVAKGAFRKDLFYRLNVMHIVIPPLRERKEDLPELLQAILIQEGKDSLWQIHKSQFAEALERLKEYDWPGNVREFRSVVQRLCLVFTNGLDLDFAFRDLPLEIRNQELLSEPTREMIQDALKKTGGKKSLAAEFLNVSRTTLWRRMKELGL